MGDVVISTNRKPVRTPDDLVSLTQKDKGALLFNVRHEGKTPRAAVQSLLQREQNAETI